MEGRTILHSVKHLNLTDLNQKSQMRKHLPMKKNVQKLNDFTYRLTNHKHKDETVIFLFFNFEIAVVI